MSESGSFSIAHKGCYGSKNSIGAEMNYFLIDGIILPRQGITRVTSGCSKIRRSRKFYMHIHYGWFSRGYIFRFEHKCDFNSILSQLLRCLNHE